MPNMQGKLHFSVFTSVIDKDPKTASLSTILEKIKTSQKLKILCEDLRKLPSDNVRASFKKKNFPAMTVSGEFKDGHSSRNLIKHSGLIQIDIDKINENSGNSIIDLKKAFSLDPFTCVLFVSPSGNGLKVFVKIDCKKHSDTFSALQEYYKKKYDVEIDSKCSDVGRLCFLSYDPDLYYNESAMRFDINDETNKTKTVRIPVDNLSDRLDEIEKIINTIESAKIDITNSYQDWLKLAFGLSNCFGEIGRSYFHRLSKFNSNYNVKDADRQFTNCLKSPNKKVNFSSIIFLLNKHQVNLPKRQELTGISETSNSRIIFYRPVIRHGQIIDVEINYTKLRELLLSFGFRRYDIGDDFVLVKIEKNVVEKIHSNFVQDTLFKYLESLPENLGKGIKRSMLIEKFNRSPDTYFSKKRYSLLRPDNDYHFVNDTKDKCYIFYVNGFVECTTEGWVFKDYKELHGFIWKSQIHERNFKSMDIEDFVNDNFGVFSKFVFNVCNKDFSRFSSLCTILGYCLHGFFDGKLQALILTDSRLSDVPDGRTGKSLLGMGLGKIKKICNVKGKDFDPNDRFKYQEADLDDKIIMIDDAKKNLEFEMLFNDITEGVKVNKKNQHPFTIKAKMIITTNRTLRIDGASAKDRSIEFELGDCYNERFSPFDEFKMWFFNDFSELDWQNFDNYMMHCICKYLKFGIIKSESINLNKRKLLENTNSDFVEFIEGKVNNKEIVPGGEYCRQELHLEFLSQYPDYRNDRFLSKLRFFTNFLKDFAKYTPGFATVRKEDERKSNDKRFIKFRKEGTD